MYQAYNKESWRRIDGTYPIVIDRLVSRYKQPKVVFYNCPNSDDKISETLDIKSISLMENNPHGWTHVSNTGFMNYVPTAPKDPLFFFSHSNVERLYTIWRKENNLFDWQNPDVYVNLDHSDWKNINNALWPWNG